MTTPTPRRYRWEIVYPAGPRRWTCPITGGRMIRTHYRRRVPIDTPPVQEEVQSPRSVLEVEKKEEESEEEDEPEEKEEPREEEEPKEIESELESTARSEPKPKELEDTGASKMAPTRRTNSDANPDIATIIAQQNGGNNGCSYKAFLACKPRDFDGKGGTIALTRWIEKMESVIENSGCTDNQRVKYAASSFINKALTWWNTQVQTRGREAANGMTWEEFKALLVEEFCPSNEIENLETKLVPHLVTPESNRTRRYIHGLVPQIRGMLRGTQPTTIQSAILTAGIQLNEAVRCGTLSKGSEKRKEVESSN
ncbi:hypothetical protein Tco_0535913 [Tanacetum coccineum]